MKKILYISLLLFSGLYASHHNNQQVVRPTIAQQDVIIQLIADVEHVQSGISPKEMVVEKSKDVLRVIGKRIARGWNWFLKVIGF